MPLSAVEALKHAGFEYMRIMMFFGSMRKKSRSNVHAILADVDGIVVPGGFGDRGVEGKIVAIQYARESKKPFFGICLGMQLAAVEFARNVCMKMLILQSFPRIQTSVVDLHPEQEY